MSTDLSVSAADAGAALGASIADVVMAATTRLATNASSAALASASGESPDLVRAIDYLFDDILGLDRSSDLVKVTAKEGVKEELITIDLHFSPGALPKELLEALPAKILSFSIDTEKLTRDRVYQIEVQKEIQTELDKFAATYVDMVTGQVTGVERGIAMAAGSALKSLLSGEIMKGLSGELADSLLRLDLPDRKDVLEVLGDGIADVRSKYRETFIPELAKTYGKLGLAEILTTVTSGVDPAWAGVIRTVGNGVLGKVIDNIVDNYLTDVADVSVFNDIKFSEVLGKALQSAFVDLEGLEKTLIDDILGLDGHGFIDKQLAAFLKDGLNGLVQDGFVDAIEFLAGKFEIAEIENLFSQFSGQFTLAQIQDLLGGFLVTYAGNQLAALLVDIDSLPEALVSQLGSVIGSGALGQVIGAISMDAVAGLFGQATANAIGAGIFNGLGAILGVGVGAVAGSLIFEFLDEMFEGAISDLFESIIDRIWNKSPQAFYDSVFDEASNQFVFAQQYDKDANADLRNAVSSMAEIFRDRVNAVIDFIGQDATIDNNYDYIVMVWGKKHFSSAYASYINGNQDQKLAHARDAQLVVTTTIGAVLSHMDFHAGNTILARAYEMWKAEVAEYGGGWDRFVSDAAYERLQSIVGLAKFANAYRQDPTDYDALMATDAPISVTILQQYLQAQSLGFNDATVLRGSHFNSSLVGSAGAGDEIYLDGPATKALGRGGDDIIHPGTAADQYIDGGTGSDTVIYDLAAGGVTVDLRITTAQQTGGSGRNTLINVENLIGTRQRDWLIGNDAANIIEGLEGADTLDGGDGIDTLSYARAHHGVRVDLSPPITGGEIEFAIFLPHSAGDITRNFENILGSAFGDMLAGDNGANVIGGGGGNDIIDGGAGDDTANGGSGNDALTGGPGFDMASFAQAANGVAANLATGRGTGEGNDSLDGFEALIGSAFSDTLTGDAGENELMGGKGNDLIFGGAHNDRLYGDDGNDQLYGDIGGDKLLGGAGKDTLYGWDGDDQLNGGNDADLLFGDAGKDELFGGDGKDTLYGWDGDDQLNGGNDADLMLGDAGNDILQGDAGDDMLSGWTGHDELDGGGGADTMAGGAGNDLFFVTEAGDLVLELADGGADTIITAVNITLPDHVEALRIAEGVSGIIIDGGAGNDVLIGNGLANNFNGGAGDDVILAGSVTLADIYTLFAI